MANKAQRGNREKHKPKKEKPKRAERRACQRRIQWIYIFKVWLGCTWDTHQAM